MNPNIKGVIVPLLTPFDQAGELDTTAVKPLVNFLIDRGVKGLFPGGTTGEGPLLNIDERRALAEAVIAAAEDRVPVIIHTGAITTQEAVTLTQHAQAAGAQAAAVVPPFFYHLDEHAMLRHFETIAHQAPDFPIYLYDNPAVTGNGITTDLARRLAQSCPNIIGIKDSSGSLDKLAAATGWSNFNTANGSDALLLPSMALGVDACVSGNANCVPELVVALYGAASSGDLATARLLQTKLNQVRAIVRDGADLSLFKGILAHRGISVGTVRPPLLQAPAELVTECWQALNRLELNLTCI